MPTNERRSRLDTWERASEWPLTVSAIVFLLAYSWDVIADLQGPARVRAELVMDAVWFVFVVDFAMRLILAPRRLHWLLRHLLDLAAVALPVLRSLRLLRLVSLVTVLHRNAGRELRGRITVYVAGSVVLLAFVAALAVLDAERQAPDASIVTFGDALFWAMATITTVGYGDLAPVTHVGRAAAVLLMIGGIALIGVVTATLASWIVSLVAEENAEQEAATRVQVESLQRQVAELSEQIKELKGP